ncbi:MAG: hypothetical protein HY043_20785 [Verrucomicrobia bacterium]|nr:hypothetical protein [Verrucomicrobiota bacterium]
MDIENELLKFISTQVVQEGVVVDEPLISSGKVDSLGLVDILTFVEQHYHVDLLSAGNPKDFESVLTIAAAIRQRQS